MSLRNNITGDKRERMSVMCKLRSFCYILSNVCLSAKTETRWQRSAFVKQIKSFSNKSPKLNRRVMCASEHHSLVSSSVAEEFNKSNNENFKNKKNCKSIYPQLIKIIKYWLFGKNVVMGKIHVVCTI